MTLATRCIVYSLHADAASVAREADRALEGRGVWAMVSQTAAGEPAVWLVERDNPVALGRWLLPGQQLIVTPGGSWEIEGEPGAAT